MGSYFGITCLVCSTKCDLVKIENEKYLLWPFISIFNFFIRIMCQAHWNT